MSKPLDHSFPRMAHTFERLGLDVLETDARVADLEGRLTTNDATLKSLGTAYTFLAQRTAALEYYSEQLFRSHFEDDRGKSPWKPHNDGFILHDKTGKPAIQVERSSLDDTYGVLKIDPSTGLELITGEPMRLPLVYAVMVAEAHLGIIQPK